MSVVQRDRQFFNLETANTFGIIFDASDEANYNRVSSFVRHIQSKNKIVKAIGFINYKLYPHYIMQKITFDYITLKDINQLMKPVSRHSLEFIQQDFDILIDFNLLRNPILRYISGLSLAKFKIGRFDERDKEIFDFMIQGIEDQNTAVFAKEVLHYLEVLQPKN
ncbi:MAG: hypothetical protein AUJ98_07695 [Bacteroidetes bacterium CG2_30_33_31]|nr:MAG: hypothetical protein AUJ98_07695 [Bacteroidetes bacterium CG2_30_33_31]